MMPMFNKFTGVPFEYGRTDCCQFVSACVEELTGQAHATSFPYTDQAGAEALLEKHGGLEGLMTHVFGEPVRTPQNGYVAMIAQPELVGIVYNQRVVARTMNDVTDLPIHRASRFWNPWPA